MTRRHTAIAWAAATATWLLIILGGVVRITGSGLGCGNHWPLCNGYLIPVFDLRTLIEWSHRLVAALVTVLVLATAWAAWRDARAGAAASVAAVRASYTAVALLAVQVALGAITVKLDLPAWTIVLHLGTAMLLFACLLVAARHPARFAVPAAAGGALAIAFAALLFGALTANLGAASACLGFPLCNGAVWPAGNYLQHVHWTHRLIAYALFFYLAAWAWRAKAPGPRWAFAIVVLQVAVGATMVLLALPEGLRAAHVAVGAAVWGAVVLAAVPAHAPTPGGA